jgi:thiol-disulfide isomerase/thioredoxin
MAGSLGTMAGVFVATGSTRAQDVQQVLSFKPTQASATEYDTPATAEEIAKCKLEKVTKPGGWVVRDGQGRILRKFVDSRGSGKLNQWSYYQDGFEVYRESDTDGDEKLDEVRWLNSGGSRIALVRSSRIVGWKRLSAEEASHVLVKALVTKDLTLLESVMVRPEDLASVGIGPDASKKLTESNANRAAGVEALLKQLVGWTDKTTWLRFDGHMPFVIPADAGGLTSDLLTYENGVVFVNSGDGTSDPTKTSYLQVPEMIKIGDSWKFVSLPRVINPGAAEPAAAPETESIRSIVYRNTAAPGGIGADPALDTALKALADYDTKNAAALGGGNRQTIAQYHVSRVPVLKQVMLSAPEAEKVVYLRQIVDSLAAASQTGVYEDGFKVLDSLAKEDPSIASYVAFRKIAAEFALANEEPGANLIKVQRDWLANLEKYLTDYPKAPEAPEALLQLASINEFNADEDKAKGYYKRLGEQFPDTEFGKKAIGALKRLEILGQPLPLKGKTTTGQTVDLSRASGKHVAVVFWASWAEPARKDLAELTKLASARSGDLEVVTVSLDNTAEDLQAFLKANPVSLPIVFEPGGMEGRLATEYGIISLPTVFLLDPSGKVSNRLVRTSAEIAKQLDRDDDPKSRGVASGAAEVQPKR